MTMTSENVPNTANNEFAPSSPVHFVARGLDSMQWCRKVCETF